WTRNNIRTGRNHESSEPTPAGPFHDRFPGLLVGSPGSDRDPVPRHGSPALGRSVEDRRDPSGERSDGLPLEEIPTDADASPSGRHALLHDREERRLVVESDPAPDEDGNRCGAAEARELVQGT